MSASNFHPCHLCIDRMDQLTIMALAVGKVIAIDGTDITPEFFVLFHDLRRSIEAYNKREVTNESK